MTTIKLRVIRALWFRGASYAVGATIDTDPRTAVALLDAGRAMLCDPSDLVAVNVARRETLDDALRMARRQVVESAPAPGWWGPGWAA